MTAVEFRQRYDGEGMLQRFREELVLPFADVLRRFSPLAAPPRWAGAASGLPAGSPRAAASPVAPTPTQRRG